MSPYPWKCPKCGSGASLSCESRTDEHDSEDPDTEPTPCTEAACYACGWSGTLPPEPPEPSRLPVSGGLRVRVYDVLERAVSEGIESGWARAHKRTDRPTDHQTREEILRAVMGAICEWFDVEED